MCIDRQIDTGIGSDRIGWEVLLLILGDDEEIYMAWCGIFHGYAASHTVHSTSFNFSLLYSFLLCLLVSRARSCRRAGVLRFHSPCVLPGTFCFILSFSSCSWGVPVSLPLGLWMMERDGHWLVLFLQAKKNWYGDSFFVSSCTCVTDFQHQQAPCGPPMTLVKGLPNAPCWLLASS